jgi:hypothetical protein
MEVLLVMLGFGLCIPCVLYVVEPMYGSEA